MASCHYCGTRQPRRRLRPLELSAAGDVAVCRDTIACQERARLALRPAGAPAYPETRTNSRTVSLNRVLELVIVLVVVLVLLPHITIGGHHWRFFVLP